MLENSEINLLGGKYLDKLDESSSMASYMYICILDNLLVMLYNLIEMSIPSLKIYLR